MELSDMPAEVQLQVLLGAHYRFQFLIAAYHFGLFDVLDNEPGLTVTDIATRLDLREQPTRILLLGCTAIGLLRKEGEGYYNTPLTKPVGASFEASPAAFIPRENRRIHRAMVWFLEALKEGTNVGLQREFEGTAPTLYGRIANHPELEAEFHTMMAFTSRLIAEEIGQKLDLSAYTHLLDVGGGTAVNAETLAARWPNLRITIGDLPSVLATTNKNIETLGLTDRVRTASLDALNDEFPTGCDAVLFAHFLEIWSTDRVRALLAKAARALTEGGGIFIVTPYQSDDGTGPERAAYVSSSEGMVYTGKEYEEWLIEAGFEPTGRAALGEDTILISGRKTS
jgi:SAM-dependent methyltransferase